MADKDDGSEKTIAEDLVVTKYKMAAEITNSKSGKSLIWILSESSVHSTWASLSRYFSE